MHHRNDAGPEKQCAPAVGDVWEKTEARTEKSGDNDTAANHQNRDAINSIQNDKLARCIMTPVAAEATPAETDPTAAVIDTPNFFKFTKISPQNFSLLLSAIWNFRDLSIGQYFNISQFISK